MTGTSRSITASSPTSAKTAPRIFSAVTVAYTSSSSLGWSLQRCAYVSIPRRMSRLSYCPRSSNHPDLSGFRLVGFGRGPSPALHAPLNGVYDRLAAVAVLEGRPRALAHLYPVEEVFDCVHEGVLVSDDVPRRPPPSHVRVLRLGQQERAETGRRRLLILEVHLQLVHPLQVEDEATLRAVDLERLLRLAPRGQGARLEGPCGSVLEARQERRRVVHRHPIHLRVRAVRPFAWTLLDKGLGDAYHLSYGAHQEMREVYEMGPQVREGASSPGLPP